MEKELEIKYFVHLEKFRSNILPGMVSIKPKLVERGYFIMKDHNMEFRVSIVNQESANMGFKKHYNDPNDPRSVFKLMRAYEWITKIPTDYAYELLDMCENKIYRFSNAYQFTSEGFTVRIDRLLERFSGIVLAEIEIPYVGYIEPDDTPLPGLYPMTKVKSDIFNYYNLAQIQDLEEIKRLMNTYREVIKG